MNLLTIQVILLILGVLCGKSLAAEENGTHEEPLKLVNIEWIYVEQPLVMILFLIFVGVVMIAYHHTGIVAEYFPETCLLLILGVVFGVIFWATDSFKNSKFTDEEFLLFMLPPIVLDAAYQLNNKGFTSNLGTILLYAVVGTLINFGFIGGCLYGLSLAGATEQSYTVIDTFLFSSFVVAVDPVAVIAIFKAVGVNDQLYYMVFGESLFNDAVTIVMFELMKSFTFKDAVAGKEMGMAVAAFIVHSCGAVLIGFLMGILSSLVTKFTKHVRYTEPIMLYIMAYCSYLLCELLGWSGIIGLAVCCLTQTQLAFQNLSEQSYITLTTGASVLGILVEATVFLFLGIEIVNLCVDERDIDWLFILWAIILVLLGRLITVFGLNAIINLVRKDKIPYKEQFIMWWAGLRGALAFALATIVHEMYTHKFQFIAATIAVIVFTLFAMGISMRPMVKLLKIKMKDDSTTDEKSYDLESVNDTDGSKIQSEESKDQPSVVKRKLLAAFMFLKKLLSQTPGNVSPVDNDKEEKANGHINYAYKSHSSIEGLDTNKGQIHPNGIEKRSFGSQSSQEDIVGKADIGFMAYPM